MLGSIIVGCVQAVFTFISVVLTDRAGRKPLLAFASIGMAIFIGLFGVYKQLHWQFHWLSLLCVCGYIGTFSLGMGPLPWAMMAELLPLRARAAGSGLSAALNWTFSFTVTEVWNWLQQFNGIQMYAHEWKCSSQKLLIYLHVQVWLLCHLCTWSNLCYNLHSRDKGSEVRCVGLPLSSRCTSDTAWPAAWKKSSSCFRKVECNKRL